MVASLARNLEHELRAFGPLPASRPALQLRLIGSPSARLGDRPLRLTLRQFEILAVLCLAGPVTLGELHAHLYGDRPVTMTTLKAEISRLRARDDEDYETWRENALERRYNVPRVTRMLDVELVLT